MNDGELQQVAPPEVAYDHPANEFVATFLGSPSMNTFETVAVENGDEIEFRHDGTTLAAVPHDTVECADGEPMTLGLRPEDVRLSDDPTDGTFAADVTVSEYQGNDNFIHLSVENHDLMARVPSDVYPNPDETLGVTVSPRDVYLFDADSGIARKTRGLPDEQPPKPSVSNP
nr:TOBE domain-containing protein [Haladaptatus sp. R4]